MIFLEVGLCSGWCEYGANVGYNDVIVFIGLGGMMGSDCFFYFQCMLSDPCRHFPVLLVSVAWVAVRICVYFLSDVVVPVLSRMVTWV